MEEFSRVGWSAWAAVAGALFVAFSAIAWLGLGFLSGTQALWLFPIGLLGSAAAFTIFSVVEGVPNSLRRSAVFAAFALAPAISFPPDGRLLGAGMAVVALLLVEFGAWRLSSLRKNLRQVRFSFLARRVLPFYFSAVSFMCAAAVLASPLSAKAIVNPFPEEFVRRILSGGDVALPLPSMGGFRSIP